MKVPETFWIWLAWRLPRHLVYWAAIRLGCNATQDEWANESPTDLRMVDALKRWELSGRQPHGRDDYGERVDSERS